MTPLIRSIAWYALVGSVRALAAGPLDIELVSTVQAIQPGKPFHLALSLRHAPGYHTYWKHPGIVGLPTRIQWENPPRGFAIAEIAWPAPERTRMFKIKAQGYERDVVLPIPVTPPSGLAVGTPVTFRGIASWMCCANRCEPGFRRLEITLPVVAVEVADPKWAPKVAKELASQARESKAWSASAEIANSRVVIVLRPQARARPLAAAELPGLIYFTEDGVIDSDGEQSFELRGDGSLVIQLHGADPRPEGFRGTVTGVVVRDGGWEEDGGARAMRIAASAGAAGE